jgi:hypothetical protein
MTRTEIYHEAVENFRKEFPQLKAVDTIASRIFISPSKLYAVLEGERSFTLEEEEHFFSVCEFPQGFDMKREFVFPTNQSNGGCNGITKENLHQVSEEPRRGARVLSQVHRATHTTHP